MWNQSSNTFLETEQIGILIQVSNLRLGFWWQNMAVSSKSHNMHTHLSQFGLILDSNSCTHRTLNLYSYGFVDYLHVLNTMYAFKNLYYYFSFMEHKRRYCQSIQGKVFSEKITHFSLLLLFIYFFYTKLYYVSRTLGIWLIIGLWCFYGYLLSSFEPFTLWKTASRTLYWISPLVFHKCHDLYVYMHSFIFCLSYFFILLKWKACLFIIIIIIIIILIIIIQNKIKQNIICKMVQMIMKSSWIRNEKGLVGSGCILWYLGEWVVGFLFLEIYKLTYYLASWKLVFFFFFFASLGCFSMAFNWFSRSDS